MFKRALIYCLTLIIMQTVFQWVFRPEIRWGDNIGVTVTAFFIYLLVEWIIKSNKKDEK